MLEPSLWSYEDFLREKAHLWVGNGGDGNADYVEVDRRRQMEGKIIHDRSSSTDRSRDGRDTMKSWPEFGHAMRDAQFSFEHGYLNLNHGGRGALPKYVKKAKERLMGECIDPLHLYTRKDANFS